MRNVIITIDGCGKATTDITQLGFSGEHNAAQLIVNFKPEELAAYSEVEFFRIVIDGSYSDKLYLQDEELRYMVPSSCMKPPAVHCQVVGYKATDGEPDVIIKSEVVTLEVERSEVSLYPENTNPNLFERAMEKCDTAAANAQSSALRAETALDDAVLASETSKRSADLSVDSAKQAEVHATSAAKNAEVLSKAACDYFNVANALKRKTRGKRGTLKDVSPLEHEVKIKMTVDDNSVFDVVESEKLAEFNQKGDRVMLETPTDTVHVVFEAGNFYTVSGTIPLVSGQDLTALNDYNGLAITPSYAYGESLSKVDVTYTIVDKVLSWKCVETVPAAPDVEPWVTSGSIELESAGQKIIGFCQVYGLDGDNPYFEHPEYDSLYTKVTIYDKTIPDVTLTVGGKNLLKLPENLTEKTVSGVTFTPNSDGTFTVNGKNNGTVNSRYSMTIAPDLPAGNYMVSGGVSNEAYLSITISKANGNTEYKANTTFTLAEGDKITGCWLQVKLNTPTTFENFVIKPQIETGTTATEYEQYITPVTYIPEADGTVKGVKSIYPSMYFSTNNNDVTLDIEYNRDLIKVIEKLENAIVSTGGNL